MLCLFRKLRNQSKDKQGVDLRVEASPADDGCASLIVSTRHADVYFEYVDGKLYILFYFFEYNYDEELPSPKMFYATCWRDGKAHQKTSG